MTELMITLGPATTSEASQQRMLDLGVRCFRFPASKFSVADLAEQAAVLKDLAEARNIEINAFVDLPGSKPRFDNLGGFTLKGGRQVRISFADLPVGAPRGELHIGELRVDDLDLRVGDMLVAGDGDEAFEVVAVEPGASIVVPQSDGELGRKRGVSVVGKSNPYEALTSQDRNDLRDLAATPFDAAIISFAEGAGVIEEARGLIGASAGRSLSVMAKVETQKGVANITELMMSADAILLGRGDLLLDCGPLELFECTRTVLRAAAGASIPVVVGTQVMPSLSASWLPNRSELAYASHLIDKGVDGLMLSTETTVGKQPHRTVELLHQLIERYGQRTERALLGR